MVNAPEACKLLFNALVDKLFSYGWVTEKKGEDAKIQYDEFLALPCKQNEDKFANFNWKEQRLDEFLGSFTKIQVIVPSGISVRLFFVLSHGQITIERGFSINKDLLVENLDQESLIGQHIV